MRTAGRLLAPALLALLGAGSSPAGAQSEEPPAPPPPPRGDHHGAPPSGLIEGEPGVISGRVVPPSGSRLPAALEIHTRLVRSRREQESGERAPRIKDIPVAEDGSFSILGLEPCRSYEVSLSNGWLHLAGPFSVPSGTKGLELSLERGGAIRGRVVDASGEAVGPGVRVEARRTQRGWCGFVGKGEFSATVTVEDGSFIVEYLGSTDFTVSAWRDGTPRGESPTARLVPEGSSDVVLRFGPQESRSREDLTLSEPSPHEPAPSAITGRLLSKMGTLLPEFFRLEAVPEAGGPSRGFYPSPRGLFDTGTLVSGVWTLRARSPSGLVVGERKGVRSGSRGVEIALQPFGSIGGRVLGTDGTPVGPGFQVHARASEDADARRPGGSSMALTREDGSFLVEYLGEFPFTLRVHPPRGVWHGGEDWVPGPAPRGVPTGSDGVSLHLLSRVSVQGRLLDADGKAVAGVYVSAKQQDRASGDSDQTRTNGEFLIRRLAAGRFRASVTIGEQEFDLGEHDAPAEGLVLRLPPR